MINCTEIPCMLVCWIDTEKCENLLTNLCTITQRTKWATDGVIMHSNWASSHFTRHKRLKNSRFLIRWYPEYFGYLEMLFQELHDFRFWFRYSDRFCIEKCTEYGIKVRRIDQKRPSNTMHHKWRISKITLLSVWAQFLRESITNSSSAIKIELQYAVGQII